MCVADGREAAGQRGALRRGRVRRVPAPLLPSAVTVAQPPAAAAAAAAGRNRRRRGAHGRHDAARLRRARIPAPGHGGGRRAAASVEAGRDRRCGYSGGPRAYWSAGTGIATNRNRLCHSTLSARCGRRWAAQRAVVAPRSPLGAPEGLLGRCATGSHPLCSAPPALAPGAAPTSAGDGIRSGGCGARRCREG